MPFKPIPNLDANPLVRIFFSGQLVIAPAKLLPSGEQTCEVFINSSAANHQLSIEARQKRDKHPDIILMRHSGPLAFAERFTADTEVIHGMVIGFLPPDFEPKGVRGYDGTTASGEGLKLDHAISLETLHPPASGISVEVDKDATRPSILLNEATLYTAERTARDFELTKPGTTQKLTGFASLIGANIYADGRTPIMRWRQNGIPVGLPFTPPTAADPFTYEVYVTNDPLFDPTSLLDAAASTHDELKEYYKVLPGVPTTERFSLKMLPGVITPTSPTPGDDRGSTRTPCLSVLGTG